MSTQRGSTGAMMLTAMAIILLVKTPVESQPEQVVEVVIKNFTYAAKQKALRLGVPTAIKIVNEDSERHDFGSTMFEGFRQRLKRAVSVEPQYAKGENTPLVTFPLKTI